MLPQLVSTCCDTLRRVLSWTHDAITRDSHATARCPHTSTSFWRVGPVDAGDPRATTNVHFSQDLHRQTLNIVHNSAPFQQLSKSLEMSAKFHHLIQLIPSINPRLITVKTTQSVSLLKFLVFLSSQLNWHFTFSSFAQHLIRGPCAETMAQECQQTLAFGTAKSCLAI